MFDIFKEIPEGSLKIEYNEYKNEYLVYVWVGWFELLNIFPFWAVIDNEGNRLDFRETFSIDECFYYDPPLEDAVSSEINDWRGVLDRIENYYIKMQEKQADKNERELKDEWKQVDCVIRPGDIQRWLVVEKEKIKNE